MSKGDNLALALVHKSDFVSDHDLNAALDLVKKAEGVEGVSLSTKFEAEVQKLKLFEWMHRDPEFDALYLKLSEDNTGPYINTLTVLRLRQFLRQGNMDAAQGLIDSVKGKIGDDMDLALKGEYLGQSLVRQQAPAIIGKDISGEEIDLANLRGKVVAVMFFTVANPKALRFVTILNDLYGKYSQDGLEIIGVSMDVKPDEIDPYVARNKIDWLVMHDADGKAQGAYFVMRDPKTFTIDKDGKVTSHGLEGVLLRQEIIRLLGVEE